MVSSMLTIQCALGVYGLARSLLYFYYNWTRNIEIYNMVTSIPIRHQHSRELLAFLNFFNNKK